ncbi:hypothetical protein PtA15_10A465 [Puccinia triticina]|uniref:Uncharacterized protein n=1 Tax=Puccinia triticina TaxID=208348 RepID=A0ABY7CYG0_9BASI|nr:uncharacterized protein PtA15_10A465 [Puccinia triticina]WAQ89042.1 hypothetical protein PtA15_10A465 [Puccinia triticina]
MMFSSDPSLGLMNAKFGSPVSQPSPTNTCSSTTQVNDGPSSGHAAAPIHDKPPQNFNRRNLYPMDYEEAAFNLQQIKSVANRTNALTTASSPSPARAPPSN